ncbi:hypothetical protein H4582DRAFT_706167 [Lactarius indigo]|nr:hypothetical protein H4582DRAFT_706167 [Lactarius indigo]
MSFERRSCTASTATIVRYHSSLLRDPDPTHSGSKSKSGTDGGPSIGQVPGRSVVVPLHLSIPLNLCALVAFPFYCARSSDHDLAPPPQAPLPPMSTPPPNASTPPTFHIPPVISVPTTPLGAVQTMISLLSPPGAAQGAPSPHAVPASPAEISPECTRACISTTCTCTCTCRLRLDLHLQHRSRLIQLLSHHPPLSPRTVDTHTHPRAELPASRAPTRPYQSLRTHHRVPSHCRAPKATVA